MEKGTQMLISPYTQDPGSQNDQAVRPSLPEQQISLPSKPILKVPEISENECISDL
jgi:hypothetical protein